MELIELKTKLCKVLLSKGIAKVVISYYGSGDSGGVREIEFFDEKEFCIESSKMLRGSNPIRHEPFIRNLYDEVECFAGEIISAAGYDGYENNDGGNGTITLNTQLNKVTIQHNWVEIVSNAEKEVAVLDEEEQ